MPNMIDCHPFKFHTRPLPMFSPTVAIERPALHKEVMSRCCRRKFNDVVIVNLSHRIHVWYISLNLP